ncbi:MAG TPA: aspartyl protease family protein, partial [Puia sp.]|nr:aspartyl protease family protein [Puia sp.]
MPSLFIKHIGIVLALAGSLSAGNDEATRILQSNSLPDFSTLILLKKDLNRLNSEPVVVSNPSSCVIPFVRAGNLILIKAKVDTTEGNFILDTGAPNLVLNMTYFRNYPSSNNSSDQEQGGVTGSVAAVNPTSIDSLSFGSVKYFKMEADRINLGHIENSKGVKILGLLGTKLFKQFELIIDYEKSLIYLHLIGKKESASYKSEFLKDTATYTAVPIDIVEDKIVAHAEMAGKKLRFVIDSGAESNVLDS